MDGNGNVVMSPALELGLKLFEHSMAENAKLGEYLMQSKDNRIALLEKDVKEYKMYIFYVQDCISLHVIPRDFDYWFEWIAKF